MKQNPNTEYTEKYRKHRKSIANTLAEYYANLEENLAKQIKHCNARSINKKIYSTNTVYLTPTNTIEVILKINNLKNNKLSALDEIKAESLKDISQLIVHPLTYLINQSFQVGLFPDDFEIAIIKPVHKSGDKAEVSIDQCR